VREATPFAESYQRISLTQPVADVWQRNCRSSISLAVILRIRHGETATMSGSHVTHDANSIDALSAQVAEVLRLSEVRAVAQRILSGKPVHIGQIVDYTIVPPPVGGGTMGLHQGSARPKPYRVAVEPWHLEEAERMLNEIRRGSAV
jgi:purine nucleoside phosphorylase